jgi:hypothetical protein
MINGEGASLKRLDGAQEAKVIALRHSDLPDGHNG